VSWKFVAAFVVVYFVKSSTKITSTLPLHQSSVAGIENMTPPRLRLLYLVTLSPDTVNVTVWKDAIQTLTIQHDVDVMVITDDKPPTTTTILPELSQFADSTVVWKDATPYEYPSSPSSPPNNKLAYGDLSLQHRYVVKDRLPYYDLILSWHAAANITPGHVAYAQQFTTVTTAVPAFVVSQSKLQLQSQVLHNQSSSTTSRQLIKSTGLPSTAVWMETSSTTTTAPGTKGWIMSPAQIWHIIQHDCPLFLPTVTLRPQSCTWPMWIDQANLASHTVIPGVVSKSVHYSQLH
jgi:hypothetical protein